MKTLARCEKWSKSWITIIQKIAKMVCLSNNYLCFGAYYTSWCMPALREVYDCTLYTPLPWHKFLKRKNTVWPSSHATYSLSRLNFLVFRPGFPFCISLERVRPEKRKGYRARESERLACPLNQTVRFWMISYRIRIPKFHQIARKISKSFKIERLKLLLHWIDNRKHF